MQRRELRNISRTNLLGDCRKNSMQNRQLSGAARTWSRYAKAWLRGATSQPLVQR